MTRAEKLRGSIRVGRQRLDALKEQALGAAIDVSEALARPGVPTRRLADLAYAAHMVLSELWSEARLVADVTRDPPASRRAGGRARSLSRRSPRGGAPRGAPPFVYREGGRWPDPSNLSGLGSDRSAEREEATMNPASPENPAQGPLGIARFVRSMLSKVWVRVALSEDARRAGVELADRTFADGTACAIYRVRTASNGDVFMSAERTREGGRMVVLVDAARFLGAWRACSRGTQRDELAYASIVQWQANPRFSYAERGSSHGRENPVPLARVVMADRATIRFTNGRHRTIWLLAHGAKAFPVECRDSSAELLQRAAGLRGTHPVSVEELLGDVSWP